VKSKTLIRHATVDDSSLLAELGASTFYETFAIDNSEENMSAYIAEAFNEEKQTAELSDNDCLVLFAETDGVACGYSMIWTGPVPDEVHGENPIELVRLYVARDVIGTGVGAALMRASIDEAARRGFKTIWLGVWENNHRAQTFYRKWGFKTVGTHVFQLGDDAQTDFVMQRSIKEMR
jgi:ribosomal protein S18 acetylase RimI-like enzyme